MVGSEKFFFESDECFCERKSSLLLIGCLAFTFGSGEGNEWRSLALFQKGQTFNSMSRRTRRTRRGARRGAERALPGADSAKRGAGLGADGADPGALPGAERADPGAECGAISALPGADGADLSAEHGADGADPGADGATLGASGGALRFVLPIFNLMLRFHSISLFLFLF